MTQAVTLAQLGGADTTLPFRNRIINGGMVIDQRNAGASVAVTDSNQYILDRWQGVASIASSKFTVQQSSTAPSGFSNSLLVTSSSAYSVTSGDYFMVRQKIEGFNTADLMWGSSDAKTVTLSFWVRSSLTGTFGAAIVNSANSYSYPFSYTISSANTWQQIVLTIIGPTAGTWVGATSGIGLQIKWSLGSGSTYSGTAGAWVLSDLLQPTGSVSVVGTSGATWYITGVQLETGTVATPFERRPYGMELALCQRYCYVQRGANGDRLGFGYCGTSTLFNLIVPLPVSMRATPTLTSCSSGQVNDNQTAYDSGAITIGDSISSTCVNLKVAATGMTIGRGAQFYFYPSAGSMILSAEL